MYTSDTSLVVIPSVIRQRSSGAVSEVPQPTADCPDGTVMVDPVSKTSQVYGVTVRSLEKVKEEQRSVQVVEDVMFEFTVALPRAEGVGAIVAVPVR